MSAEEKVIARAEARAAMIEKGGEGAGLAGVPFAGESGKVAALLSNPVVRGWLRTHWDAAMQALTARMGPHLATLRVAAELQKAQFRHLPQGTIEEIIKHPHRPPIVR